MPPRSSGRLAVLPGWPSDFLDPRDTDQVGTSLQRMTSRSIAPVEKSRRTASSGTPAPVIVIPICPVARNSPLIPRLVP